MANHDRKKRNDNMDGKNIDEQFIGSIRDDNDYARRQGGSRGQKNYDNTGNSNVDQRSDRA